jgi:hypothetical protein
MNRPRNIKEGNRDCFVRAKNKDGSHVVVVSSPIIKMLLNIGFPTPLEVNLETVYCGPDIGQLRMPLTNGLHVLRNCFVRENANLGKRIIAKPQ